LFTNDTVSSLIALNGGKVIGDERKACEGAGGITSATALAFALHRKRQKTKGLSAERLLDKEFNPGIF
jgi:hypothetical protein